MISEREWGHRRSPLSLQPWPALLRNETCGMAPTDTGSAHDLVHVDVLAGALKQAPDFGASTDTPGVPIRLRDWSRGSAR